GTLSSTNPGRSCPSRDAIGRQSVTQSEDWYNINKLEYLIFKSSYDWLSSPTFRYWVGFSSAAGRRGLGNVVITASERLAEDGRRPPFGVAQILSPLSCATAKATAQNLVSLSL